MLQLKNKAQAFSVLGKNKNRSKNRFKALFSKKKLCPQVKLVLFWAKFFP
jgi:hypothetical protein